MCPSAIHDEVDALARHFAARAFITLTGTRVEPPAESTSAVVHIRLLG